MTHPHWITRVFAGGLLLTPLVASPFVLDFTLTARFIILSIAVLVCVYVLYRNKAAFDFKLNPVSLFYLSYVLICMLSVSWANTKSEALFDNSKLILSVSVFFLSSYLLKRSHDFNTFLYRLPVIVFCIGFIVAIYQLSQLKSFEKEAMYEVTGINGHKNLYSSFLFLNLFLLIRTALRAERTWKIISVFCVLLTLGMIVLLRTKAAWIGIGVTTLACLTLFALKNIRVFKLNFYAALILLAGLVNIFFFVVLPPVIKKTIIANAEIIKQKPEERQKAELDNERLVLWDKSYGTFKKHPVTGVGMGNWQISFQDETLKGLWRSEDLNYTFQRPHNDFLWILSETGMIGFNLFLLFILSLIILAVKTINYNGENKSLQLELSICVAFIIGYLIISFFDFPKERIEHLCWSNLLYAITFTGMSGYAALPVYRLFKTSTLLPVFFALMLFVTVTATLRYKGEYYTRKMYDSRRVNSYSDVIKNGTKALSYAYTIDPTSLPIAWFTGNATVSQANYVEAQKDFEKAYQLNPYNRNVINDLASSYAYTSNKELAKKYYREAARVSPRFDEAKLNLVAILIQEQKFKEASNWLDSIYHDSPRRSEYRKMVDAMLQTISHYPDSHREH